MMAIVNPPISADGLWWWLARPGARIYHARQLSLQSPSLRDCGGLPRV